MSFAGEVRDELYEGVPKKSCCRRALAAGLLLGAETEDRTVTVRFPSEAEAACRSFPLLPPQSCCTPCASRMRRSA